MNTMIVFLHSCFLLHSHVLSTYSIASWKKSFTPGHPPTLSSPPRNAARVGMGRKNRSASSGLATLWWEESRRS